MKIKRLKFPKTRTCLISDMLTYASTMNGLVKDARKAAIINEALTGIAQLSRIPLCKWRERKKYLRALENIDRIGIMESLELATPKAISSRFSNGNVNEMKVVAEMLGLYIYKIDRLVVVLRTPLTLAPQETRSLAEMAVSERGNSSPELPLV